ncbi:polysaccharide deacetylase family protein [Paenibacillus physcomitrellae]|uniref:polysaccharide deacetylase family protein n=1 Tax=Paenibacillus physcomitrellae TaxID=1619311 RepID=UPI00157FB90D|nr:polysaccharide deacetylase family protein [Paenibacillus physcomitrellae]
MRKVNTLLAAAVVVLASISIYTASTNSTAKGNKTVNATTLGANPTEPSSAKPVHESGSAEPEGQNPSKAPASDKPGNGSNMKDADGKEANQATDASSGADKPVATPVPTLQPDPTTQPGSMPKADKEPLISASPPDRKPGKQPLLPASIKTKTVYLTFDDGPGRYTDQIAAILAKNNIHATFFAIGENLKHYPKQVNHLLDAGHYVGLHSMSHDYNKLYKSGSSANFIEEFQQEQALFKKITGQDVDLIRAPYGSAPQINKKFRDDIVDAGFKMWDWTVDSEDWSYKNHPEKVIGQVKRQVRGNLNVILMHETKQTVQALPQIIAYLKNKGYAFAVYKPEEHLVVNFAHDDRL